MRRCLSFACTQLTDAVKAAILPPLRQHLTELFDGEVPDENLIECKDDEGDGQGQGARGKGTNMAATRTSTWAVDMHLCKACMISMGR